MSEYVVRLEDENEVGLSGYPSDELKLVLRTYREWCSPNGEVYPRKADPVSVQLTAQEAWQLGVQLLCRSGFTIAPEGLEPVE